MNIGEVIPVTGHPFASVCVRAPMTGFPPVPSTLDRESQVIDLQIAAEAPFVAERVVGHALEVGDVDAAGLQERLPVAISSP